MWVGARKPGIAVARPLHGRAHAIPVAQKDIFAHANLIAIVQHWCAWQGKEEAVEQPHPIQVVLHQRGQTSTDTQIEPHAGVDSILPIHVVTFLVRDHFQGQFIMVA